MPETEIKRHRVVKNVTCDLKYLQFQILGPFKFKQLMTVLWQTICAIYNIHMAWIF